MFMFDLQVENLTDAVGQSVIDAVTAAGAWPVAFVPGRVERRWFGIEKSYPTVLEIQSGDVRGSVLATEIRDADTVDLRLDARHRLGQTLAIIADHFPSGFVFIATHSGSPIQRNETPTPEELVTLAEESRFNEFTRYRVQPR